LEAFFINKSLPEVKKKCLKASYLKIFVLTLRMLILKKQFLKVKTNKFFSRTISSGDEDSCVGWSDALNHFPYFLDGFR
jgi:hypothetical protein